MDLLIPPSFKTIDWSGVPEEPHNGESGCAYWRVRVFDGIRVRLVRYSENYLADHWCKRGHVLYVLSGQLNTELENGDPVVLGARMGYIVGDGGPAHRSSTVEETTLFIVDSE